MMDDVFDGSDGDREHVPDFGIVLLGKEPSREYTAELRRAKEERGIIMSSIGYGTGVSYETTLSVASSDTRAFYVNEGYGSPVERELVVNALMTAICPGYVIPEDDDVTFVPGRTRADAKSRSL